MMEFYYNKMSVQSVIIDKTNQILYMHFDILDWLVKKKIANILTDCDFPYVDCELSEKDAKLGKKCAGYKVVHVSNMEGMNEGNFILYKDYFDATCTLIFHSLHTEHEKVKNYFNLENKELIEIWDVCTQKKERGKGVLNKMLQSIVSLVDQNKEKYVLWLGIDPFNEFWPTVLNTYTKFGFIDPYITYKTPQQVDIPVTIGLYRRHKPIQKEVEEARVKAEKLKQEVFGVFQDTMEVDLPKNACTQTIYLSKNILEFFYSLLNQPVEYGGNLRIINERLGMYESELIKGTVNGVAWEKISSRITFHTHPSVTLKENQIFLGWPSGMDMNFSFLNYYLKGMILHLVITPEGIYFMSLNPWFQKASRHISKKCLQQMSEIIQKHFLFNSEVTEVNRSKPFSELQFENYMRFVNNFTFNDIFNHHDFDEKCKVKLSLKNANQPIYDVKFHYWKDFENWINQKDDLVHGFKVPKIAGFDKKISDPYKLKNKSLYKEYFPFTFHFYISNKDKYKNIGCELPNEQFHNKGNVIY